MARTGEPTSICFNNVTGGQRVAAVATGLERRQLGHVGSDLWQKRVHEGVWKL